MLLFGKVVAPGMDKEEKIKLPSIDEMVKAGAHLGHKATKWNPKMKPYIAGVRNDIHLIDLEQTFPKLETALKFLKETVKQKKNILFVGTDVAHKKIIQETADKCKMPYVNERWAGGLLTNFKAINKRLEYFRDLEQKKEAGELGKYTKKEQHELNKELERLSRKFGGVKNMVRLPDAIFVSDCEENFLAVKEARVIGIPVVGLCDTNIDPTFITYPIPVNDDAISSVKLILDTIVENIKGFV